VRAGPFRRLRTRTVTLDPFPDPRPASRGVEATGSFLCGPRCGLLDSPAFEAASRVSMLGRVLPIRRSPGSYAPGSFFLIAAPLQSSFARLPPETFRNRGSLPGFRPSSRHHQARPHARGVPSPRFVPSTGSLSLPTVSSALDSAGLFHPAAASRARFLVQGLLSPHVHPSSSEGASPMPLALAHSPSFRWRPWTPASTSRLLSVRSCVPSVQNEPTRRPLPSSSSVSSRYSLFPPSTPAYPGPSTHEVIDRTLRLRADFYRPSPVYFDEKIGSSISKLPTRSRLSSLPPFVSSYPETTVATRLPARMTV